MTKLHPPAPRPVDRTRVLVASGVAVLAIVTVILCVLALLQFRGTPSTAPTSTASESSPSEPNPGPSAAESPSPSPSPAGDLMPPTRLLAAYDGARVYRAWVGACPDPRTGFERSVDGGATWQGTDLAGRTDSSRALTLTAGAPDFVQLVTLRAQDCAAQYVRSFVGGIDWEVFDSELAVTWYFDPARPTVVHTPQGERAAPCTAVSLAATRERAAVLCTDSTVVTTADAGATWGAPASVPNVAAIAVSPNGYRIAVLNTDGCAGIQLGELVDGSITGFGDCLPVTTSQADVALTTAGDGTTFVWAGDVFSGSPNGGATW